MTNVRTLSSQHSEVYRSENLSSLLKPSGDLVCNGHCSCTLGKDPYCEIVTSHFTLIRHACVILNTLTDPNNIKVTKIWPCLQRIHRLVWNNRHINNNKKKNRSTCYRGNEYKLMWKHGWGNSFYLRKRGKEIKDDI